MVKSIHIHLSSELQTLAFEFARVCDEIVRTGGKQPPRFKNASRTIVDVLAGNPVEFEMASNVLDAIGGYVVACKQAVEKHGEPVIVFESAMEFMELAEEIQDQMQIVWGSQKPGSC